MGRWLRWTKPASKPPAAWAAIRRVSTGYAKSWTARGAIWRNSSLEELRLYGNRHSYRKPAQSLRHSCAHGGARHGFFPWAGAQERQEKKDGSGGAGWRLHGNPRRR